MMPERRETLEAAGHRVTTPEDFFGLDDADRRIVAFRLELARMIRRLRDESGLSRDDLTIHLQTSASWLPIIEKARGLNPEDLLAAIVAAGGLLPSPDPTRPSPTRHRSKRRRTISSPRLVSLPLAIVRRKIKDGNSLGS